ncbi:capsid protein [Sigmofec virus UA08Rod_11492]|uniref:Capsid protein n=1 Tax=Sigmofec virus UA08Rod_11492 TaxID=2929261 RepID=A0A976R754_9VIRU|nr:capsid protein [Sigmofec virus UA08Rod_11492]
MVILIRRFSDFHFKMGYARRYKSYHGSSGRSRRSLWYRTRRSVSTARYGALSRLRRDVRKMAQGRIQNWRQTKMTGTGLKIRRRGRRAKRRYRIKKRRQYRRGKRRYINWLYRNRPAVYYSVSQGNGNVRAVNLGIFTGTTVNVPNLDVSTTVDVNPDEPASTSTQLSDYICYKSHFKFIFNMWSGSEMEEMLYRTGYIRILCFRKWGSVVPTGVENSIFSIFKYPYLATSGYVKGFYKEWCKQFGVQLYIDKLLRVSDDTKWTAEYQVNIYPNIHTRYDSQADANRYFYQFVIIGGFGADEKFGNVYKNGSSPADATNSAMIRFNYNTVNYWKYVNGMVVASGSTTAYRPSGLVTTATSNRPRSIKMDIVDEQVAERQVD